MYSILDLVGKTIAFVEKQSRNCYNDTNLIFLRKYRKETYIMSDSPSFKIEKNEFKGYSGPDIEVLEIPEGVTKIGEFSLRNSNLKGCSKIVFPASVNVIGRCALNYDFGQCKDLVELEFMGDIKTIEYNAFDFVSHHAPGDTGIKKITFHGKVGEIGDAAFNRAKITELDFPAGVDVIGKYAFNDCVYLQKVHAPGLKKIGNNAFDGCKKLAVLDIPANTTIGDESFHDCEMLKKDGVAVVNGVLVGLSKGKRVPEGVVTIDKYVLSDCTDIPMSVRSIGEQRFSASLCLPEGYLLTDEKLGGKGLMNTLQYRYKLNIQECAALYLFQSGKQYDEILEKHMEKDFNILMGEMVGLLETKGKAKHFLRAVEFVMNHADEIPGEMVQKLYDIGVRCQYKKETPLLEQYLPSGGQKAETQSDDPCAPWREIFNEYLLDKALKPLGLKNLKKVPLADGSGNAPEYLVKCAIGPYVDQFEGKPKHIGAYTVDYINVQLNEHADRAAALLDRTALQQILEDIDLLKVPQAMLPYCRYTGSNQITKLLSDMRSWESWYVHGATGRAAIIIARGALMLSDCREAMMYIDKCGVLDTYAKIRGTDADTIRDQFLSNIGLDESGGKTYDLGNQTVTARLQKDLNFLVELPTGKTTKSLPKKGADAEKYATANADFSEMKKSAKKIVKNRVSILFEDFLSGRARKAAAWKESYLKNPLLRQVASLLVWVQDGKTFLLTDTGAVTADGTPYSIGDAEIALAHPMDMTRNDVTDWQKWFTANGIKQPFEQIWEPVVEPNSVTEDRYRGCMIPYYRFLGQNKHGIYVEDEDFHNEIDISFDDCNADIQRIDWLRHEISPDHRFEIRNFCVEQFTRKANHIIAYLDRVTIYDRIRKDDTGISTFLPQFTLAQITEFIKVATENNCTNVTALLLDYKNQNFADFDPMEEFSLEL